ncbi:MAG: hypothetical protein GVY30_12450, partial [Chloroflexi bacterium]|nr:hypothetical protein [Chloroflexota bacterium]
VYLSDILMTDPPESTNFSVLLRIQWLGIAFTPPFYAEFVRSIRISVQEDNFPTGLRVASFLISAVVAILALTTDLVVYDGTITAGAPHLRAAPLFYPFAALFIITALLGLRATLAARKRCYTRTARRRMAYLSIGFAAPALGVFPYLLAIGWPETIPGTFLWALLILGNVAVGGMLILMAYGVAFIGALTPDRVIKHRLVRFLLRGPVAMIIAMIAFGAGLTLERAWGLGDYTLSLVAFAAAGILCQLGIELAKSIIDIFLYRGGRAEVAQVQELAQRLITTTELHQFLENVLTAMCELLQSSGGFVALLENDKPHWEIGCNVHITPSDVMDIPLTKVVEAEKQGLFILWHHHWMIPVHDKADEQLLGLIGLREPEITLPLANEQEELLSQLLLQVSAALEDRRLQHTIFRTFSPLLSELEDIQRRGGMLRYEGDLAVGFSLTESPELPEWVYNALTHYWGGPRLTDNPLLELEVVKQAAHQYDGNVVKGLRAVLTEGIERLRPDGARKLTAPEWLLYNILEMKFLRGQKVRDIAMRLAVSESSFYRKQRVAIENLADIIAQMEEQAQNEQHDQQEAPETATEAPPIGS